ncbi:hypothetical protein [Desulfatitalea tepidiphila]|uniref:hypothetical protein n=1 Tax=Desulfatitalea tepidiphila TaxID=1185843 RepID=UPI00128F5296|nr:hypothetical protein [Desulfatitalea tepidiphila]
METILDRIKTLPGVSCVLLFDPQLGTISQKGGNEFTKDNLSTLNKTLEKFYSWGAELFSDIVQIRLQFADSNLSIRRAGNHQYIVILHQSPLDENLLDLTISQSANSRPRQSDLSPDQAGVDTINQNAATENHGALLRSEPVSKLLSQLENALNKVMGPIAAIVFNDTRQAWIGSVDRINQASIERLVNMLCAEIDDQEKIATFKNLIAPHLNIR